MAYLYRLISCALLVLSAWLPTYSYASFAATPAGAGACTVGPCYTSWYAMLPTRTENNNLHGLCASAASYATSLSSVSEFRYNHYTVPTAVSGSCVFDAQPKGATNGWYASGSFGFARDTKGVDPAYSCPSGASISGTTCTCTLPALQTMGNTCEAPSQNACVLLSANAAGNFSGSGGVGAKAVCDTTVNSGDPASPGCSITGVASTSFYDPPNQVWQAAMTYTGAKCLAGSGDPVATSPTGCPVGQVSGLVNGEPYCYKPDSSTPKTTTGGGTSSTNNPDGSRTTTSSTQTTSCTAAGACTTTTNVTTTGTTAGGVSGTPVTTSTTSTCQRGSPGCQTAATNPAPVTTTTSTTGSTTTGGTTTSTSGSSTTTSTTSGGTGGNGSSSSGSGNGNGGGGEGGMFSGKCGAIPICDGDAVMCAVAAATFTTNCTLSDPKVSTPLYDLALTKSGDQTGSLTGNSTVNVGPGQFDQTELLGAAVGMTDRTISVAGHSISVPFSSINIWLARLGLVLQAVTFLVCARIVIRG